MLFTKVTSSYEHALACVYHNISKRGLLMDTARLQNLDTKLKQDIYNHCAEIEKSWNKTVYLGNMKSPTGTSWKGDINLNAGQQIVKQLQLLGFKVPKGRNSGEDSAEQLALIRLFAKTGDDAIRRLLEISKLKTVLTRYVRAKLFNSTYYSQYAVTGTLSGRRGSKKHIFGLGNNSQNWPKYSDFGKEFRHCIIARPGKIFFSVDQKQAEDYPVCALAQNHSGLLQLRTGVDRHSKTAAFLFSIPESQVKKYPDRFLGKKTRHANNYGMWKNTYSDMLAKDGMAYTPEECEYFLKKMDEFEPSIKEIFHAYIQAELSRTRMLVTPFGRERIFFGLRPRGDNTRVFMEAYAQIPQSTVADNTGFGILSIDMDYGLDNPTVHECHDSITLEIDDNYDSVQRARETFIKAFDRDITFYNGITVKIPVEGEFGYNLKETFSTEKAKSKLNLGIADDDMREDVVIKAWKMAQESREIQKECLANSVVVG